MIATVLCVDQQRLIVNDQSSLWKYSRAGQKFLDRRGTW